MFDQNWHEFATDERVLPFSWMCIVGISLKSNNLSFDRLILQANGGCSCCCSDPEAVTCVVVFAVPQFV